MPIYEYQCDNCEHKMEAIHKISDAPPRLCPVCEQETLRKLVSAAAFKLTGNGWYETDFKDKKSKDKEENKSAEGGNGSETVKTGSGKESKEKRADATAKTSEKSEANTPSKQEPATKGAD